MEATTISRISTGDIIDLIKSTRDELIESLYLEGNLSRYLEDNFNNVRISKIKKEFLLRDLIELKQSRPDLVYYSSLIKKMKELNTLNIDSPKLILSEIFDVVKKYIW